ncbi:glycosyltransferase [Streptomyces mobaraensis NBRC 13819 = DSM 40847]|uniref:D-inositol 3-phosphate glycosyltransferase n=1 Tax=Streptomyces mobaraensis (strain ATCC 29032 / DSM 40847 / JCM 4168 / NBRC 13819 / NCIMB 11159 / IPCR 16-22) TaxID=1223523 RepID=M3B436_STRM1|nr:glycosyltransferase [Streptomyces mobaraensis]EMF00753.1 group 1 glycosyl transferase [Streptomyces mobaraensis NBRC 13819 = DSM 40847]QTT76319.1 glycosyltransferase [Streptomyces mobaraensis NBRC 13819 = DSM 40847]
MRISFLLHNAYTVGGTIRSTFNLAAALAAAQHDVEIISAIRYRETPVMGAPPGVRLTHLVDLCRDSPHYDGDDPRHARPARVFPRADGRHRQYSRLTDERIGRYLSGLETDVIVGTRPGLNVHIARQAHPDAIRVGQEHLTLSGHGLRLRHEIRHRYPLLDALTTVTEADAHAYRGLALPGVRIRAIANSVPAAAPAAGPAEHPDRKVVVAAGRLIPVKRYDLLIRAFAGVVASHPDWRLRIFGRGDTTGDERRALTALIDALGLHDHVSLDDHVDNLEAELAKASIAVSTSDRESFGMTIVEAMRCGLPVVATDCPNGPREIITDGVDGRLVRPGDTAGVTAALCDLIRDDATRRRMGEAAHRNSARFTPSHIAAQHLALYEELLSRGPGKRALGPLREAAHRSRTAAIDTAHALRSRARRALKR